MSRLAKVVHPGEAADESSAPTLQAHLHEQMSDTSEEASSGSSDDSVPAASDPYAELLGTKEAPVPLQCRFSYLDCNHRPFKRPSKWVEHMLVHFRFAGPAVEGAKCRFCKYTITPEALKNPGVINMLQDYEELPEGGWPLTATELQSVRQRLTRVRDPKQPMQYPYSGDIRVTTQAKALWYLLRKHVLQNHTGEDPGKATTTDIEVIRYLDSVRLLDQADMKQLETGGRIGEGISTHAADSRGGWSRGRA